MSTATLTPPLPASAPAARLLTAADLAALPTSLPSGDVRYELDDGRLVRAKKEEYFDAGVRLVWVLDPDDRTVTAHQPGQPAQTFQAADALTTALLPGFAVPVVKLFAGA